MCASSNLVQLKETSGNPILWHIPHLIAIHSFLASRHPHEESPFLWPLSGGSRSMRNRGAWFIVSWSLLLTSFDVSTKGEISLVKNIKIQILTEFRSTYKIYLSLISQSVTSWRKCCILKGESKDVNNLSLFKIGFAKTLPIHPTSLVFEEGYHNANI